MKTGSLLVLPSMGMPEPQATEETPGIAWILFRIASCMRTTCSRSGTCVERIEMRKACSSAALGETRIDFGERAEGANHQAGTNEQD